MHVGARRAEPGDLGTEIPPSGSRGGASDVVRGRSPRQGPLGAPPPETVQYSLIKQPFFPAMCAHKSEIVNILLMFSCSLILRRILRPS